MTVREFARRIAGRLCLRCGRGEHVHRRGLAVFTWLHDDGRRCDASLIHEAISEMEKHGESQSEEEHLGLLLKAREALTQEGCYRLDDAPEIVAKIDQALSEQPLKFPCACTRCHCLQEVEKLGALCEGCLTRCQNQAP